MQPLGDVRIIAIEQYGAGPFGTLHLADMGAEVIKGLKNNEVSRIARGGDTMIFSSRLALPLKILVLSSAQNGREVR